MTQLTKKQYTQSEKLIFSAGVIGVLVIAYALIHFKSASVKLGHNEPNQINYEMAKLQSADSLYSLEDREIEKDYKALAAKKAALKATQNNAVEDKTKKAAVTPKTQLSPQQKAAQLSAATQAARSMKAAMLKSAVSSTETEAVSPSDMNQNRTANYADANTFETPKDNANPKEDENKKSYEKWKAEIFAAQSREIILQLTAAYKKGDVTAEDFQKLVNDMLASKDDKMIGLGLYALRANPSYASYVQLVKLEGKVGASYNTYIQESLMSYHQNGLGVLKQSLASADKAVVLKTLEILKSGVASIKAGTGINILDPRYRRTISTFSLSSYMLFLPALRDIVSNSNDPELINLASQSITIIDDPQYIASN